MIQDHLKLLMRLYTRPLSAMSGIIDDGNLLFTVLLAVAVSVLLGFGVGATFSAQFVRSAVARSHAVPSARGQAPAEGRPAPPAPAAVDPEDELAGGGALRGLAPILVPVLTLFSGSMISTVFALALLYAPATILLVTLFESVGSFGVAFRRDYGSLLACTLMAWAA